MFEENALVCFSIIFGRDIAAVEFLEFFHFVLNANIGRVVIRKIAAEFVIEIGDVGKRGVFFDDEFFIVNANGVDAVGGGEAVCAVAVFFRMGKQFGKFRSGWDRAQVHGVQSFVFANSLMRSNKLFFSSCFLRSSRSFFWSLLSLVGVMTLTMTNWSPRPMPSRYGMPFPLRRNWVPVCVPDGILSVMSFSSVGTEISSPSAAWLNVSGIVRNTSLSLRSKMSLGCTCRTT